MAADDYQGAYDEAGNMICCPIQASPHQSIFNGPFHTNETYAQCQMRNNSNLWLIVNVKMSEPDYIRSTPKVFFLMPGQTAQVRFIHQPFIMDLQETYARHQIGFFYMEVQSDWCGSARQYKDYANQNEWFWQLCRMRIIFNFTPEDYDLAQQTAAEQQVNTEQEAFADGVAV